MPTRRLSLGATGGTATAAGGFAEAVGSPLGAEAVGAVVGVGAGVVIVTVWEVFAPALLAFVLGAEEFETVEEEVEGLAPVCEGPEGAPPHAIKSQPTRAEEAKSRERFTVYLRGVLRRL